MKDIIAKAVEGGFSTESARTMITIQNSGTLYKELCFDSLIFSHDFLRTYFKPPYDDKVGIVCRGDDSECGFEEVGEYWEFHAQQLVLSEDRLEYLRRFL